MKNHQKIEIVQGGYSAWWLQPCYLVASGLVLLIAPLVGLLLATMLALCMTVGIAVAVHKFQEKSKNTLMTFVKVKQAIPQQKPYLVTLVMRSLVRVDKIRVEYLIPINH